MLVFHNLFDGLMQREFVACFVQRLAQCLSRQLPWTVRPIS